MIGDNIRELRELKKMSRREFGEALYVSQDVINNIERNRVVPTELMIKCICDTFNVNREWLETGVGEMFEPTTDLDETAKLIESISESPAMRSLLATYAKLSDENKAVFERFAAEYVDQYQRACSERDMAALRAEIDSAPEVACESDGSRHTG